MSISLLDRLFRRPQHLILADSGAETTEVRPAAVAETRQGIWTPARVAQAEALWGEGFVWPGGADEIKRLVAPFGLSAAHSLLFVGIGAGGPARTLAGELGTWVTGFEADPVLLEAAERRIQRAGVALAKRATIGEWDQAVPIFQPRGFHHAILLDVLDEARPAPLVEAAIRAVKPGGQIAVVQYIGRVATERAVSAALVEAGCDVRVFEDESQRHARLTMQGWKLLVRSLRGRRPTPAEAASLVAEAAYWLHRLRSLRDGRARLLRWVAIVPR